MSRRRIPPGGKMIKHKKVDVVTVGAGWTAAILAWKLTEAGHRVVSVDQGPARWADPDFSWNHDSLRYSVRKAMMIDLSKETWTWRPNTRAPSLPMRQYGSFHPGQGIGGSAAHWSAMLWRFTPYDFKYRTYYIERYGEKILPENCTVQDWPLTYEELEPYYDAFEYDIGASGQVGNLGGVRIEGGNPFEGPRSRPYPNPPLARTIPSGMFAEACRELGYHPFPEPSGILSQAYTDPFGRTRSGCMYCGFCTRFGCEVDAKSTGITTHTPLALQTGRYDIRTHSKVLRVNTNADGRATGVTYLDALTGEEHEQPAEVVILSGYTLGNVHLMLLSQGKAHPDGIGNDQGMLGKNMSYQIWQNPAQGVFDGHRFNLFMGNTSTINCIYDFYGNNIDHAKAGFIGGSQIFSTIGEREPVTSAGDFPIMGGKNWGREWKESLRKHWDNYVPITIQGESPSYAQHFFDLDPVYKDAYGRPLLRFTFDWTTNEKQLYAFIQDKCVKILRRMGPSQMTKSSDFGEYNIHSYQSTHVTGGAIMGTNPGNSVTNKYGQVWDTPNVFVTGAALYPQNAAANPTGTLCALSYMTGDAMRDRYFKNPDELMT
ncbi:MAG TPA: GMC family oxidoreductase [Trueperaceae bacterium]